MSWVPAVRRLGKEEAVAHGHVTLIMAAERWNPERGIPFKDYAYRSICYMMRRQSAQHAWTLRLPQVKKNKKNAVNIDAVRNCTGELCLDQMQKSIGADVTMIAESLEEVSMPARQILSLRLLFGLEFEDIASQTGYRRREVMELVDDGLKELRLLMRT